MKSLALANGDIDIGAGRRAAVVAGKSKLLQDLALWLHEPYGLGPTTPRFGSLLTSYIGSSDEEAMIGSVVLEVRRILALYQAAQQEKLTRARREGTLGLWSRGEVLQEITSVKAKINLDAVIVTVRLKVLGQDGEQTMTIDLPTGAV